MEDGSVYFQVPAKLIGREIGIWMSPAEARYRGDDRVVAVWGKRGEKLRLEFVGRYEREEENAWALRITDSAIGEFPILATDADGAMLIDATGMFTSTDAYTEKGRTQVSIKPSLRFRTKAFVNNVVVKTYSEKDDGRNFESLTLDDQWNFFVLPDEPIQPRVLDRRAGHDFPGRHFLGGEPRKNGAEPILRWRLNESGETTAASPKSAIEINIDPNTPERWKPWIRRGIEAWQDAFEAAGFKNAIKAVDPDRSAQWSYESIDNTVLCWRSRVHGCGRTIFDARTGELFQYQVGGPGIALESYLARYVVTMAAVDKRVLQKPISEGLLGELVQMVAAHETGHILGLRDGSYGTYSYSASQVRSRKWVERMGFTPSIMNYTRFNYVAQAEDDMPASLLIQQIGPADYFSIKLGYANVVNNEQRSLLDDAYADPIYRYNLPPYGFTGPDITREAVEVIDPIRASKLGLRNLKRSLAMLGHDLVSVSPSDNELRGLLSPPRLYEAALEQWFNIVRPVGSMIDGYVVIRQEHGDDLSDKIVPISREDQDRAVGYICATYSDDFPDYLVDSPFVRLSGLSHGEAMRKVILKRDRLLNDIVTVQLGRLQLASKVGRQALDRSSNLSTEKLIDCIGISNIDELTKSRLAAVRKMLVRQP